MHCAHALTIDPLSLWMLAGTDWRAGGEQLSTRESPDKIRAEYGALSLTHALRYIREGVHETITKL